MVVGCISIAPEYGSSPFYNSNLAIHLIMTKTILLPPLVQPGYIYVILLIRNWITWSKHHQIQPKYNLGYISNSHVHAYLIFVTILIRIMIQISYIFNSTYNRNYFFMQILPYPVPASVSKWSTHVFPIPIYLPKHILFLQLCYPIAFFPIIDRLFALNTFFRNQDVSFTGWNCL